MGTDERRQTLNQLLVEMDGFAPNTGVIIMGPRTAQKSWTRRCYAQDGLIVRLPSIGRTSEGVKR